MLKVNNLNFSYNRGKPVINNVSLEIKAADFIGIIGPNGSGKTTLLKLLSGLLQSDSGEILVKNKSLHSYSVYELAKLRAFVPQENHLEFDFSVEEIVWMGRSPYADLWGIEKGKDKVEQALQNCELLELKNRNARTLSGGEWQRVVLAKALVQDTEIIMLDEPTHFLDIYYQLQSLRKLKELNRAGKTIIAVFHDLNLAAMF
ncbi:ABC transporter ATP-binding protein, partial [Candidatus Margulisiibacteriota bacterium]